MSTVSFNKTNYIEGEPVIVYGASVYGELAYIALKYLGIIPDFFCDKSQKKEVYFGIKVITLERLNSFKSANIIIASADFFDEIKDMLEKNRFEHIFDMSDLLKLELPFNEMSNRAMLMFVNRNKYINIVNNQEENGIIFNRIQYVVTERCSLKCKDCSHLIQYYKYPKDIDLANYKASFERLLQSIDCVAELRILGGEPFMNKNIDSLIREYGHNTKIQEISIYTNGTIVPENYILRSISENGVIIHISNYRINEKSINQLVKKLEEYSIKYFVREYEQWQDAGSLEYRNFSREKMEDVFQTCIERKCYTFLRGKLYRCPRSAHGMNLKGIPDTPNDYVDFNEESTDLIVLKKKIRQLQKLTCIEACQYCSGLDNHEEGISAAIQIKKSIRYNVIK